MKIQWKIVYIKFTEHPNSLEKPNLLKHEIDLNGKLSTTNGQIVRIRGKFLNSSNVQYRENSMEICVQ